MTPSSCEDVYLGAAAGSARDPRKQSCRPFLAFCGHGGPLPASELDDDSAAGPSYQTVASYRGIGGEGHGDPLAVLVALQRPVSAARQTRAATLQVSRHPASMVVSCLF